MTTTQAAVAAIHQPIEDADGLLICSHDNRPHPCPTTLANSGRAVPQKDYL